MLHPVTIENDAVRMEVWPALGGKVSSLIDKADKFELLFNFPAELPTEPHRHGVPMEMRMTIPLATSVEGGHA